MYQYKAVLRSNQKVVAVAHDLRTLEHHVLTFRRGQKHGQHSDANVPVEIYHVRRDNLTGKHADHLVKTV